MGLGEGLNDLQHAHALPAPLAWPTPRQRRIQSMFIALLFALAVAPCALLAIGAAHDRMLLAALPAASLLAVACGGAAIAMQAERKLGVVLVPLRGGPDAQVEIRPRPGTGVGLVIPFGRTLGHVAAFRTTTRSIPYVEAAAVSPFGMVYFGVGAATLPRELVAWTQAVHDASGSAERSPDAIDLEKVAAAAARHPFDVPAGVEAEQIDDTVVFRYRGGVPLLRAWLIAFAIATLSPLILPVLRLASWSMMGLVVGIVESVLLYGVLLCGPLIVEFEVSGATLVYRRRRFGLTLWISAGDARMTGLDVTGLPSSGIRCGGRVRGITSPDVRGPDAAAVAWVAAAIHATAASSHR